MIPSGTQGRPSQRTLRRNIIHTATDCTVIVPPEARLGRLMVILADPLTPLIRKGEVTPRYFNPGNLFRDVQLVICAPDEPDPDAVQSMVGEATWAIHNHPIGRDWTVRSLLWRPALLRPWAQPLIQLADNLCPQLIRCYHGRYNAFAASEVKRRLGIPYVVSLHAHPETSHAPSLSSAYLRHHFRELALESVSRTGLRSADKLLPVYSPIIPWLERRGLRDYEIVYNAVGTLSRRHSPPLGNLLRVINVGRQEIGVKNPMPIVEAVARTPDIQLTVIGDGPLHRQLVVRAASLGASDRISFVPRMPNEQLLECMAAHHVMAFSTQATEFSKVCIEAALMGLSIVHSDLGAATPTELRGDHIMLVKDTAAGYSNALRTLAADPELVRSSGEKAYQRARRDWAPDVMEARVVDIYRRLADSREGTSR